MTHYNDANLINLSTGQTLSYAALDQMLEKLTVIEVAQELSVPFTELVQALKARHKT